MFPLKRNFRDKNFMILQVTNEARLKGSASIVYVNEVVLSLLHNEH